MPDLILPGLIDVHTHLRMPGGEHKEDFASGTAAALAGGITMLLAMPNTSPPLTTVERMQTTYEQGAADVRCDVGLFAGASPEHVAELPALGGVSSALKIYLNDTFGPLRVEDLQTLMACFQRWPRHKLIAMHAEKQSVAVGIGLAAAYQRPVHFCHISRRQEILLISKAKKRGLPVTCEVTPHHLFLNEQDAARLGPLGDMRPPLATPVDVDALWAHLSDTIDCIATDHAPHTLAEKQSGTPPPGVAGLETSLPLMITAVQDGRLSIERLVALMHTNPKRIYGLPTQPDTQVEVKLQPHIIHQDNMYSKCGWTPFEKMPVAGRVSRVILRGKVVFDQGQVIAAPGSGKMIGD